MTCFSGLTLLFVALAGGAEVPPKPIPAPKEESLPAAEALESTLVRPEDDLLFSTGDLSLGVGGPDLGTVTPAMPRWRVAPHLYLRSTFDDNIYIEPKDRVSDLILTLAPGIALGWWSDGVTLENYTERKRPASRLETAAGTSLYLDYTAVLRTFIDNSDESSLGHELLISGVSDGVKTRLGAELQFSSGTVADEDIGALVDRKLLTAAVDARWEYSAKTAFRTGLRVEHIEYSDSETGLRWNERSWHWDKYSDSYDSTDWRWENFMIWAATPLLSLEPGFALGYLDIGSKDQQYYQQLLLRGVWRGPGKLSYDALAGVEFRQSENFRDSVIPVGRARAIYAVSPKTRVTLEAFQQMENSALESRGNYRLTGLALSAERNIVRGLIAGATCGYSWANYEPGQENDDRRRDGYFFVSTRLVYNFNRWCNAGLVYQFRRNDSSDGAYDYRDNQVSLEASFLF